MKLTSSAFEHGDLIPSLYTCDEDNVSPPLALAGVPNDAKSVTLIMDDPDVPTQVREDGVFDHWVVFNIAPTDFSVGQGEVPVGVLGVNGRGDARYTGPCPPPQYEPSEHRYFFKVYALDTMLDLEEGVSKSDVLEAMKGHILHEAELLGRYKRIQ